jgi:hypothetical protein
VGWVSHPVTGRIFDWVYCQTFKSFFRIISSFFFLTEN